MGEMILKTFSTALLCGIIFLIATVVTYFYPPKKINSLYGYRTSSSMKSQERWDFAQKISTAYMFRATLCLMVFSLTGIFFRWPENIKSAVGMGAVIVMITVFIAFTEKAIKQRFPES